MHVQNSDQFKSTVTSVKFNSTSTKDDAKSIEWIEQALLNKMQTSLTGIPPPPCVTDCRIDPSQILAQYKQNEDRWSHHTNEVEGRKFADCLNKPTHSLKDIHKLQWPDLLKVRAHGLSYNHSSVTENIEMLGLRYADRFIGSSETSSTFNTAQSSSNAKKRKHESLASRVSHLAHRRSVFSLENLRKGAITFNHSKATSKSGRLRLGRREADSKNLESCKTVRSVDKENDEESILPENLPRKDSIKKKEGKLGLLNNSLTTFTEENYKKKLLWAVSQALEAKQISTKHVNFKLFATNLTRMVNRLFSEVYDHSVSSSTSETLLRLANKHVLEVIQDHTGDDINIKEKTRIINARNTGVESSKNSIIGGNVDFDLRRKLSQPKMFFSGKDQQNIIRR